MSSKLSVEACQALRDMGYPQDADENHWVYFRLSGYAENWRETCYFDEWLPGNAQEYVGCPDAIDALDWIEQEKGIFWERRNSDDWRARERATGLRIVADNLDALLIKIAQYIEQKKQAVG